jgi:hypothetical protein
VRMSRTDSLKVNYKTFELASSASLQFDYLCKWVGFNSVILGMQHCCAPLGCSMNKTRDDLRELSFCWQR